MTRANNIVALTLYMLLMLVSVSAWAENTLLSSQEVTPVGENLKLDIRFNQRMDFLSYFPKQRGTQLQIRMRPINGTPNSGQNQIVRDELQQGASNKNPVRDVSYEQDNNGNGVLTVQFSKEIRFVVNPVRDQRTIEIMLLNVVNASTTATNDRIFGSDLPIYVINLQTATEPIDADAQPVLKNFRAKYAIYAIKSTQGGETQFQLRLGYFHSFKLVSENVRRLKPFYPYAEVNRVIPLNRRQAEEWFARQDMGATHSTQDFRVKQSIVKTQPPAKTSVATTAIGITAPTSTGIAGGSTLSAAPSSKPISKEETGKTKTTSTATQPTGGVAAKQIAPEVSAPSKKTEEVVEAPTPSTDSDTDSRLMTTAKQAIIDQRYRKASSYLTHILQDPKSTEHQEAQELLGLAYERRGLAAQARAEYEKYLKRYPKGLNAERVKQRLVGLLTASSAPVAKLKFTAVDNRGNAIEPGWRFYGTFSQYYNYMKSSSDVASTQTYDNSLSTGLVLSGRNRGAHWDQRIDFNGNYFNNFNTQNFNAASNKLTLYSLFYDLSDKVDDISMRVGRQSHSSDGVLTRFDGIKLNKRFGHEKFSLLAGFPVDYTYQDSSNTDRKFYALSVKFESLLKNLDTKFYFMQQTNSGITDRKAVGNETQYVGDNTSVYFMYDYDIFYKELNLVTFIGNWRTENKYSFNLSANYRNNPLLTTSNALVGQSATTLEQLRQTFSLSDVQLLARDRTSIYRSLSLSANKTLSARYQLIGDVTVSSLDATPASGGVAATPATGNLYYYNLALIANNLLVNNDVAVLGARYFTDVAASTIGISFSDGFNINSRWRIKPRFAIDVRSGDDGSSQTVLTPRVNLQWRPSRAWQLELEFAYQNLSYSGASNNTAMPSYKTKNFYGYLGYRYNF